MSFTANNLRPGMHIEYENKPWQCMEAVHKTPGNKRAFVQAKMRSVLDGTQKEFKFSSTETLERITLRERKMQFLYNEGDVYHFMDLENYEQSQQDKSKMGSAVDYLMPDAHVSVTFYEDRVIGLKLPQNMTFKIIEAEPNLRSATASAQYKNATIETGLVVKVPPFVEQDDRVVVNTETGEYVERAKD